jgi:CHAT domain-containing protein
LNGSQLVISSYLTTLESLFQAQKKYMSVPTDHQKLLNVSQSDTPGQSSLPQTMNEVNEIVQTFCSSGWSRGDIVTLHGSEATADAVLAALNSCSWVHLACHGFQNHAQPMKSAFALHDGHLELHKIASKRLSHGQFAFLSACQAASGQKDLPREAMHLAAGLQFAGFHSIIATLWGICNEDALKVADHVY